MDDLIGKYYNELPECSKHRVISYILDNCLYVDDNVICKRNTASSLSTFKANVNCIINTVGDYSQKSCKERLIINTLGLTGEAGEIADTVKKHVWYSDVSIGDFISQIKDELGDVLFHVVQLATELGININDVLDDQIRKQKKRNNISDATDGIKDISDLFNYFRKQGKSSGASIKR